MLVKTLGLYNNNAYDIESIEKISHKSRLWMKSTVF